MPSEVSQKGVTSITASSPIVITPDPTVTSGNISLDVSVDHHFTSAQTIAVTDTGTDNSPFAIDLVHTLSSGTPNANIGVAISAGVVDSSNSVLTAGQLYIAWSDPTHATRTSYLDVLLCNGGGNPTSKARIFGAGGISAGHTTDPGAGIISANTGFWAGSAASTSGKILKSDGSKFTASTETYAAPGNSGNVMTSDGTNWTSAVPSGGFLSIGSQVDSYITPQSATSWAKPAGAYYIEIYCIGGGGSGAGGRSAATAADGGGGGGGAWSYIANASANFDTTLKITVGAGGAQTSQSANGVSGNNGNPSFVTDNAGSTTYVYAEGGEKGDVGSGATTGGAGGSSVNSGNTAHMPTGGPGLLTSFGVGVRGAGAGTNASGIGNHALGTGGAGGGTGGINGHGGAASKAGGGGGGGNSSTSPGWGGSGGGAYVTSAPAQGDAGINCPGLRVLGGSGGTGGGGTTHDGGAGGSPGGGGGGGTRSATSGKGGAGGDGAVIIITHF